MAGALYDPTKPMPLIEMVNHPAWMGVKPTLGQRNNNYGNLRTTDAFEGKTGVNKSYDTYETPEKGMRALARVLDTYSSKHGINTIDQLINRYAPASDNTGGSHENYKRFLAQRLGVSPNDPIDVKGRRADIMDAIIRFENKNRPLATREQLQQAIADADGTSANSQETKDMAQIAYYDHAGIPRDDKGRVVVNITPNAPPNNGALAGGMMDESYSPPPALDPNFAAKPSAPPPILSVVDDGDAGSNIDGSAVNDSAFVNTVPDFVRSTVISGANAAPQNVPTAPNPNASNTDDAFFNQQTSPNQQSNQGILSQLPPQPKMSQVSGQRRDQSAMSLPSGAVDFNDMLIRMGGRGVEASQRGGLAAFGAVTDEYGKIQDANQSAALDAYKAQLRAAGKTTKQSADDQAYLGQIDQALFDMNKAKGYLKEGGITGLFDNNIKGFFDKLSGNKRAVGRKLLEKLRVDDTLLRIAQTKGAISNKEMDLFLAPSPDLNDQEEVWEQWINDRMEAMSRIRSRMTGGQTVDPSEQASADQVNQFGSAVSNAPVSANVAAARAALSQ